MDTLSGSCRTVHFFVLSTGPEKSSTNNATGLNVRFSPRIFVLVIVPFSNSSRPRDSDLVSGVALPVTSTSL